MAAAGGSVLASQDLLARNVCAWLLSSRIPTAVGRRLYHATHFAVNPSVDV